jgi:hypothetical protein
MTTTLLAHAAGVPVEELLPLALAAGTTASVGLRIVWARSRRRLRIAGRPRRPDTDAPSAPAAHPAASRPGEPDHPVTAAPR